MNNQKVYVVILNWNGWADTIACLESVSKIPIVISGDCLR